MIALILLLAASPLAPLEQLIGDQWIASSKLPDGQEMRSRTVWTWGRGKRTVRMRQFVLGKYGEVQRYETLIYHDAKAKKTLYRVFAGAGDLAKGAVRFEKEGVVLEQPSRSNFPAMRTLYQVVEDGVCMTRVSFKGDKGWTERFKTASRRTKLTPAKKLRMEGGANPLIPVALLADGKTWKWSLHERLLVGTPADDSEVYVTFEARTGKLRFLQVEAKGGVREGRIVVPDPRRMEFTIDKKWRRIVLIPEKGERQTWVERWEKDAWKKPQD